MSGGGGSTNTIQSTTPWSGVQPSLSSLYGNAQNQFNAGGPQTQIAPVAGFNEIQNSALGNMANIANGGYGALSGAQSQALGTTQGIVAGNDPLSQYLTATMYGQTGAEQALGNQAYGNTAAEQDLAAQAGGTTGAEQALLGNANGTSNAARFLNGMLAPSYLNVQNNPALQSAMNAANYNTNFNYTNDVMPALASQYSAAGRFGSGAMGTATNQANNTLATQISNTNAGMSLAELEQLQNNQLTAGQALGTLTNTAGTNLGQLQSGAATNLGQLEGSAATNLGSLQSAGEGLLNNRQGAALQLLPGMAQQGLTNANTGMAAGTAYQQLAQQYANQVASQFNVNQMQPYNNLNWFSSILSGSPYLNTSSSGNTSATANPFTTALGGGMLALNGYNAANAAGLLGGGSALGGGALFSAGAAGGTALDAALASSAAYGGASGIGSIAGSGALMGLAAM